MVGKMRKKRRRARRRREDFVHLPMFCMGVFWFIFIFILFHSILFYFVCIHGSFGLILSFSRLSKNIFQPLSQRSKETKTSDPLSPPIPTLPHRPNPISSLYPLLFSTTTPPLHMFSPPPPTLCAPLVPFRPLNSHQKWKLLITPFR